MIVKRKSIIALLLALVMVTAMFAGCSKTTDVPAEDPKPAESTDAPKEDTTAPTEDPAPASDAAWDTSKQDEIIVTVINGYYTAGEKKLAEEYMKLHPETKVTIDVIADNNSYTTKMQTILSSTDGSNTPDIIHSNFFGDVVGGAASALEQGYLKDMSTVLDMEHPYQDGLVRDMYDETVLTEAKNGSGGVAMQALPFDKCGISFFYNKTAFAALGLSAPETWEELLEVCQAFRDNGVQNPITVSSEASWIMASLTDAGFRGQEYDFLIQPGDALWDEATMAANKDFVFDENNLTCDAFTIQSDERIAMAKRDGIIFSDVSKTAWAEFAKLAQYFPENYLSSGADTVTEFEMQISPMLLSGSWNVGLLLDDLIVFLYLSVGVAFFTALTDKIASPSAQTHFIGLGNFKTLLSDKIFWYSFRNQAIISLFAVFNSCFFPLLTALLLYYVRRNKVSCVIKTAFVLPMLVPSIVTILIWKFLYNPNFGFNSILQLFHLGSLTHNWLNDESTALGCIVLMGFPFVSGMYFLLFHTGINNIDGSLYDAARVDGATSWDIVCHVQLPGVWPYVKVVATLSLIGSLSGFGQVSALTNGGPGYKTMIPALYMYKVAFGDGRQGYSSALGVVLFFVIVALTVITNKLMSMKGEKEA